MIDNWWHKAEINPKYVKPSPLLEYLHLGHKFDILQRGLIIMPEPFDIIRAYHNAFRKDLKNIDEAALEAAKGKEGLSRSIERFEFFNEMLVWHARGEELSVFPMLDNVTPLVAEAYLKDHRGLDRAYDALSKSYSEGDLLQTARATAAFRFHSDLHLYKEDAHLYRIFKERISLTDQWKALGVIASQVPRERFSEMVEWMFPLIGLDDRENMVRVFEIRLPAPSFEETKELIKTAIGNDWAELKQRIPTL
jgi:hemerythrin-like domain-containing protein